MQIKKNDAAKVVGDTDTIKPCPDTLRVAVIGGGPSAMFFCHALETQMRQAKDFPTKTRTKNTKNTNLTELQVTCFEKAATPGGVWKAAAGTTHHNPIYQELWTNSIAYSMEFYDYTFDQHFHGKTMPMYLPRQDVNEYLLTRVTRHCPTFFETYFEFDAEVMKVGWIHHHQQQEQQHQQHDPDEWGVFEVTIRNTQTGQCSVRYFDKCVWAAGMNGVLSIPSSLSEKVESARLTTPLTLLHSSETDKIRTAVQGKRVVLIGGGFSAEDLALQCLKWGAVHLDVVARANDAEVSWTSQWPFDRVKVHLERAVKSVNRDGSMNLEKVEFKWPFEYQPVSSDDSSDSSVDDNDDNVLHDINIIIFCTGYHPNLSMLDPSLKPASGYLPTTSMGQHPSMFLSNSSIDWSTWKMKSDHDVHRYTGHVAAGQGRMIRGFDNHPDIHRGIFLSNPNMMYLSDEGSDVPLLALDVKAWLLCSYLTGTLPMPSVQQLRQSSQEQLLEQLHFPSVRYCLDEKYSQILDQRAPNRFWERGYEKEETRFEKYEICLLNRIMDEGRYPGLRLANAKQMQLNPHGKQYYGFGESEYYTRANMANAMKKQGNWGLTFRDDVEEISDVFSIYTGKGIRPLKKQWMDIVGPCSIQQGDI